MKLLLSSPARRLIAWFGRPEDRAVRDEAMQADEAALRVLRAAQAECAELRSAVEAKCDAIMAKAEAANRAARGDLEQQVNGAYSASWKGANARFDGKQYWVAPAHAPGEPKCPNPLGLIFEGSAVRCATCADICPDCGVERVTMTLPYDDGTQDTFTVCNCTRRAASAPDTLVILLVSIAWSACFLSLAVSHELFSVIFAASLTVLLFAGAFGMTNEWFGGDLRLYDSVVYDYGWLHPVRTHRRVDVVKRVMDALHWLVLCVILARGHMHGLKHRQIKLDWVLVVAGCVAAAWSVVVWVRVQTYPRIVRRAEVGA